METKTNNIILYSTGCPKCSVLKSKLTDAGINFDECNDVDTMLNLGIKEVPVLCVNEDLFDFVNANKWINEYIKQS